MTTESPSEQLCVHVQKGCDLETVETCVNQGASVNHKSKYGMPLVVQAAQNNLCEVIEYLLDRGADIEARDDNFGMTALAAAVEQGQLPAVACLRRGADLTTRDRSGNNLREIAAASDYDTTEILALIDDPSKAATPVTDFFRRYKGE